MLLPLSPVSSASLPRRNLPVRSPSTNSADGDRNVQSSSFSLLNKSRNSAPLRASGFIGGGKVRLIDKPLARRDFETAGATDHEIALHTGGAHRFDKGLRVTAGEMYRAHHAIMTAKKGGQAVFVRHIAFFRSYLRQRGDLLRIARDRGNHVTAIRKLFGNARASSAGGANQCNTSHSAFRPLHVAISVKNRCMVT